MHLSLEPLHSVERAVQRQRHSSFMGSCLSTSSSQRGRMASDASGSTASTYFPPAQDGTLPLRKADTSNGANTKENIPILLVNDDANPLRRNTGTSDGTSVNPSTHLSTQNQDDRQKVASFRRRALLVGITYTGPHNKWSPLDGPHDDVDRYRDVLTSA